MLNRVVWIGMAASIAWAAASASAADIWWEGESPAATNFPKSTWFDPQNAGERDKLSGGDWLTNAGDRAAGSKPAFIRYSVDVPEAGEYHFWARKFWKHGPFRWRFDDRAWQTCGPDIALADSVTLRTHLPANWVNLGDVKLDRGRHTFELELLAKEGEALTAAFDCFLLTTGTFVPRGKLKPGERSGLADDGCFPWEPGTDPFTDEALLDLRRLNEDRAGQSGYVRAAGDGFALGDGTPVRFWAVNVGPANIGQSHDSIDYLARKLAKLGVNMVRYHGALFAGYDDPAKIDPQKLDSLQYLVHAMAREGIYTKISFYFPIWFDAKRAGLEGFDTIENNRPFALLYFDPKMQGIYRSWLEQMLTTASPYDPVPLGRNPAVAIVEIINEDSFFFWTFSKKSIPAVHWQRLEKLFGAFLGEDGPATVEEAWFMTSDGLKQASAARRQRIARQVEFLTKLQRDFYADTVRRMRDLGYEGMVSASNWHVTDAVLLEALERYTYTAGSVIDRHGYFGGRHEGDGASYSVRTGHRYQDLSGLTVPQRMPVTVQQVAGFPHIISEINWPNPNRFRTEATTVAAAYAALQGVDGVFWFAVSSNAMADPAMTKFQVAGPAIGATLPANALLYRGGMVQETEPVVDEVLRLDDLYAMKGSAAASDQALDALRLADVPEGQRHEGRITGLDPLAFYVGRVQRRFGDAPADSSQIDLTKFIDRRHQVVRSANGQLAMDYGRGLLTIDTPRAQGAVGPLARAGDLVVGQLGIACRNDFASVLVVSLDEQPIATSKRLLVQVMTEARPYGYRTSGGTITDLGGPPWNVQKIACTITLPGTIQRVTALDENGYPTKEAVEHSAKTAALSPDAVWHIIER